jgi:hypothetical protein
MGPAATSSFGYFIVNITQKKKKIKKEKMKRYIRRGHAVYGSNRTSIDTLNQSLLRRPTNNHPSTVAIHSSSALGFRIRISFRIADHVRASWIPARAWRHQPKGKKK